MIRRLFKIHQKPLFLLPGYSILLWEVVHDKIAMPVLGDEIKLLNPRTYKQTFMEPLPGVFVRLKRSEIILH